MILFFGAAMFVFGFIVGAERTKDWIARKHPQQRISSHPVTIERMADGRLLVTPAIGRPVIFVPTPPIAAYFCQERL